MKTVAKTLRLIIVSDQSVVRVVQAGAFVGAMALMPLGVIATTKFASSPFEIFAGIALSGILAMAMVMLGLLMPVAIMYGNPRTNN